MWQVPLFDISFDTQELEAVQRVLQSGWLTMGPVTEEFEKRFADYLGVKHAIAVASCTAALHLANAVLEFSPGDEVICPALTFVAAANSILYTNATPVFADIVGPHDLTISSAAIEAKITSRTRAIQVMHYGGYPCDMPAIMALADKYHLAVIEDAAHTPGAKIADQPCGTIGTIGCFSFFSNKNMTTAEGGMVVTNDDRLAARIRLMRSHGMTTLTLDRYKGRAHSYDVVELGYNYRIDEIRAAIGLVQLNKLAKNHQRRKEIVANYCEQFQDSPFIETPFEAVRGDPAYHIFPILLPDSIDRSRVIQELKQRGIQTSIHYPPLHLFKYYADKFGYKKGELPVTEEVARRELTLPLYPALQPAQVDLVCNVLKEIVGKKL